MGQYVRRRLSQVGLPPLVVDPSAAPVITTFRPPHGESSPRFVSRCRRWGFEIGGMSRYLQARRWVQIATMGRIGVRAVAPLFGQLAQWIGEDRTCE
jgi:aspartate aminotransferase-like enzyme